jgi:hypothetical protein
MRHALTWMSEPMHFPDVDTLRLCSILASSAFGLVFAVLWLRNQAAPMPHFIKPRTGASSRRRVEQPVRRYSP